MEIIFALLLVFQPNESSMSSDEVLATSMSAVGSNQRLAAPTPTRTGVATGTGAWKVTRKTVRTVAASGPSKDTPWGVSLKPVPRKVVTEEVTESAAKAEVKIPKYKGPPFKDVKSVLTKKTVTKTDSLELQVSLYVLCEFA